ncbi:MAG: hypothetical protein OXD47_03835 [Gammaproteobacteria bacterium]|nr:hypothetical protein [Gammaproteobacteria bacterium]MCY4283031.1 hypothetical protein [Gammaproteobacteria bacterium]MCY4337910.1 hypothetical protein [Gammaproteobacteria bacterium]
MTWKDPIVEEVREIRDRIAARFDYDVKAIGRYYQQKQRESKSKKSHIHRETSEYRQKAAKVVHKQQLQRLKTISKPS